MKSDFGPMLETWPFSLTLDGSPKPVRHYFSDLMNKINESIWESFSTPA